MTQDTLMTIKGLCVVGLALIGLPALANDSTYTDLDFAACKTIEADAMGARMTCPGYRDYPIHFKEYDLRQSLFYGKVAPQLVAEGFESFATFNRVHTKLEWRLNGEGRPIATIHRWFIENAGADGKISPESTGEVLVVSRVGQSDKDASCFVAMIDARANTNANELAREAADNLAGDYECGMAPGPQWFGARGKLTSDRTFSWPEGFIQQ